MRPLSEYSSYTQDYINAVMRYLKEDEKCELRDEYAVFISMLADNVELYEKCQKDLMDRGTVLKIEGRCYKNPSYEIVRDCEDRIARISKSFGLDKLAKCKFKNGNGVIDAAALIESLMS